MRALRNFSYYDHEQQRSVVIPAGAALDVDRLVANKVDLGKLERTRHVVQGDAPIAVREPRETVTVKRKRGRPRKIV